MKAKKLLALGLTAILAMSFSACTQDTSNSTSNQTSSGGTSSAVSDEESKSEDLIPVTLQLKWVQQAQFMGYYAAQQLGIYEDFGLDVTIKTGGSVDEVDEVDEGRAQFATTWASNVMLKVSQGSNIMSVQQYYQDSGMTLVSLKDTAADPTVVSSGESTGNWGGGNEYEMQAYLSSLGLPTTFVTQDYDMEQLLSGELTWASAMTYNELGLVLESGKTMDDLNVIYMKDTDYAMLEDCLIVDTEWAAENEETIKKFIEASNLGWAWCIENPAAAGSMVFNANDTANTVSEYHQQYEATEVAKLVCGSTIVSGDSSTYVKLGCLDKDAYQQTYDVLSNYADISNITAESVYTTSFYDEIIEDSAYTDALANLDQYTYEGDFDVLYSES